MKKETKKQAVIDGMGAITIEITLRGDGDYNYRIWPNDVEGVADMEEEGIDEGDDNGGVCTGNMGDALEMAKDAALAVVRNHFSDNCFNPDVCPSSLDENGEPSTSGETDHKSSDGKECDECGATLTA